MWKKIGNAQLIPLVSLLSKVCNKERLSLVFPCASPLGARVRPIRNIRLEPVGRDAWRGVHLETLKEPTMHNNIARHRHNSYIAQAGRCCYCAYPMWENNPELFARTNNISLPQAKRFKCTAEHLIARKDGGKDEAANIVAACLWCNLKRHNRKLDLSPQAFRGLVQRRTSKGLWHCKEIMLNLLHDRRGEHASSY